MALVNIDKLYLALISLDELGTGNLKFEKPEYVPGIQQIQAKLKTDTGQLFEEGTQTDQDSIISSIDITVDLGHLSNTQYAKYLGHNVAAGGGVYAQKDDKAPYTALLIEYTKNGGVKGWKIYYKGQFTEPDDTIKQTEGKVDYQNHSVSASFQPLNNNGMWKYTVEEDDPNCPSNMGTLFFDEVIVPDVDNSIPTATVVPANGATGVETNADIVYTFNTQMSAITINNDNFILIGPAGTQITATATLNSQVEDNTVNKIVTLHPSVALASGEYTAICTKDVRSSGNVALATNIITHFTV